MKKPSLTTRGPTSFPGPGPGLLQAPVLQHPVQVDGAGQASEPNAQGLPPVTTRDPGPADVRLAYSVHEVAQILGVCDKTVRRLVARRLLRASKALRHLLISKKELERFLNETLGE